MRNFTGTQYLKIDIANMYGLDGENWDVRLNWVEENLDKLEEHVGDADKPARYLKAVEALRDTQKGIPTGHLMGLDSTASCFQIMAILMGCLDTAKSVNLVDTGNREDVYQNIADVMSKCCDKTITRKVAKAPIMTTSYGSKAQPKKVFGDGTKELEAFYDTLSEVVPGALECMDDIVSCWQSGALAHSWRLPDGHTTEVKVMESVAEKIEIDELGTSFTHKAYINKGTERGISLIANIVQSIDGYVVREMIRRCHRSGFEIITVFDEFLAHPNNMNSLRQHYIDILCEMSDMDLLGSILSDITGETIRMEKGIDNLSDYIRKSEYALS